MPPHKAKLGLTYKEFDKLVAKVNELSETKGEAAAALFWESWTGQPWTEQRPWSPDDLEEERYITLPDPAFIEEFVEDLTPVLKSLPTQHILKVGVHGLRKHMENRLRILREVNEAACASSIFSNVSFTICGKTFPKNLPNPISSDKTWRDLLRRWSEHVQDIQSLTRMLNEDFNVEKFEKGAMYGHKL